MPHRPTASSSPLSALVSGVLKELRSDRRPSREEMQGVWARVAGEEAASYSWPRTLRSRRLVVEAENSGWMHALGMRRQELLEGLTELLGAGRVRELSFRIGDPTECPK